jgi:quercetin dioxygenase-like cupin family protein
VFKKFTIAATLIACAIALYAVEGDNSFNLNVMSVAAQPAEVPGLPAGVLMRGLHLNPRTQMNSAHLSYPAGFREPRHYHETCGHYMYILKGRIQTPEGVVTPGMFLYAAPEERHGPFVYLEETEVLFYTDGPFDFIVEDAK